MPIQAVRAISRNIIQFQNAMASTGSKVARILLAAIIALLCLNLLKPFFRDVTLAHFAQPSSAAPPDLEFQIPTKLPGRVVPVGERHPISRHLAEYTRIGKMIDGSLVAAFGCEDENEADVRAMCWSRSADVGLTWTDGSEVIRASNQTTDLDNASILQLPSGRILYAYRHHDRLGNDPHIPLVDAQWQYTYFRLEVAASDDGGKTWSHLSTIEEQEEDGLWEPLFRLADDGSIQVYYTHETSPSEQNNFMKFSRSEGRTWSKPIQVSGAGVRSRDGMVGVTSLGGGELVAVFEESAEGPLSISAVKSHDDGKTWPPSSRVKLHRPRVGVHPWPIASAPSVTNVGGTLIVAFQTDEDLPPPEANSRLGMILKIITSVDGGNTWGEAQSIPDFPRILWPMMATINDTHFLMVFNVGYRNGGFAQMFMITE